MRPLLQRAFFSSVGCSLLLLFGVFLTHCGPQKRACTDKSECLGDEICAQGFCQAACQSNNDCLGDQTCATGVCRTTCSSGNDCLGDQICIAGLCQDTQGDGGSPDGIGPDGNCQPTTCSKEGKNCGEIPDGCGNTLRCGSCPQGETCGGSGTPNLCGAGTCTPKDCQTQGVSCGQAADGCGKILDCGPCDVCDPTCPQNYACKNGVCVEGNPNALKLEAKTHSIGGSVLLNGETPRIIGQRCTPTSEDEALIVRFVEDTFKYNTFVMITCKQLFDQKAANFQIFLYPGTYRVLVGGRDDNTNFPNNEQVILTALKVDQPKNDLKLEAKTYSIGGSVLLNNETPRVIGQRCTPTSEDEALIVRFIEDTFKYNTFVMITCKQLFDQKAANFQIFLYPGTYRVLVGGRDSNTNFPNNEQAVLTALKVDQPKNDLKLEAKTYSIGGSVLLNGETPRIVGQRCTPTSEDEALIVRFVEDTFKYNTFVMITCKQLFDQKAANFQIFLYPGTYRVLVGGRDSNTNFPNNEQVILTALKVDQPKNDLKLEAKTYSIGGSVLLNNETPRIIGQRCTPTSEDEALLVRFVEDTFKYNTFVMITCKQLFDQKAANFQIFLYPGTYRVLVGGRDSNTNFPNNEQVVLTALKVDQPKNDLKLEAKTYSIGGSVLLNGETPRIIGAQCTPTSEDEALIVRFVEDTFKYNTFVMITCKQLFDQKAANFQIFLYPGTYRVLVGGRGSNTNFPNDEQAVLTALKVDQPQNDIKLEAKTHNVSGSVLLNGETPRIIGQRCTPTSEDEALIVRFVEDVFKYNTFVMITCKQLFDQKAANFQLFLYPGTYRVLVGGRDDNTNFPNNEQVIVRRLRIP